MVRGGSAAVEAVDLVVAAHLERVALAQGVGTQVELGGKRHAAD
jgi:hypothetical protein